MSLSESRISKETYKSYRNFCTSKTNDPQSYVERAFLDIWQKILDSEFQKASQSNKNFLITPPAGSLFFAFSNDGETMAKNIAIGVCTYWSKAIGKGENAYLDKVTDVQNDAMLHVGPLTADILSIRTNKLASQDQYFKLIHDKIISHITSMKWIVSEIDFSTGSTTQYPEKVF